MELLIASLAGVILFFGLPALTQQPVTLTILTPAIDAAQWKPLIDDFEAQNRGIRLNVVRGPANTNRVEDLYTSAFLLGNSPYDLVYMDVIWVPKFAAAGWLMDLSNRMTEAELAEFLKGDLNGGRYKGKLYRIPLRSDAGMLYYRTDLLQQGGYQPPETFDQLLQVARSLQKQSGTAWGYLWQGRQYEGIAAMFVEILHGFGGFWVNPETLQVGLDRPAAVRAVEFLRQTIALGVSPPGVTTYSEEETRILFQNGKAVFLRSWPYVWGLAGNSPIQGKFDSKPMVHIPGARSGSCLGGWGLGISQMTKHPKEAWRAIQFLTSESAQRKLTLDTGYAAARRSLYNDPQILAKYSYYSKLLEVVEKTVLRPPVAQYAQASDILQRYLSAALTGRMSAERAMNHAAAETRRLLEARG
jgi:multiple sugar transport system substrate-binding protein